MENEFQIRAIINDRGGIPPFTVWSAGFLDVRGGDPIRNSGAEPQSDDAPTIEAAIAQYKDLTSYEPGKDVLITQDPRIVDSRGVQVYP